MWSGRGNLEQLVSELQRQKDSKVDFIADGRELGVNRFMYLKPRTNPSPISEFLPMDGIMVGDKALEQLGSRIEPPIPNRFLRDLFSEPERYGDIGARLVNDLLVKNPKRLFVRCLDGKVRAVLSNRYRVLDNYDLAFTALEVVREAGGEVVEASLSDTHMRLKFLTRNVWDAINEARKDGQGNQEYLKRIQYDLRKETLPGGPGTVYPIVTVSNSETGHGGLQVQIGMLRAICVNLLITESMVSQIHLGDRMEVGRFTEETVSAESKAIYLKARDTVRNAFHPDIFKRLVTTAKEAQEIPIQAPQPAVENIVEKVGLSQEAQTNILTYFLKDYDTTRWGLSQAISRYSQDVEDPEKASELEEIAGKVLIGTIS